jgi:Xaa-Pro aminopeptidase
MYRIKKLIDWVRGQKLEALLIDCPVDLFYLTGLDLSLGRLVVDAESAILFVDRRYVDVAKKQSHCAVQLSTATSLVDHLRDKQRIGLDSSFFTLDSFEVLKKTIPDKQWISISSPLKDLRVIKDDEEIKALKRAATVTREGYQEIRRHLKEGISEEELALIFEIFCKRHGASALSFTPIIAFGENSAYPHHRAGKSRLQNNQIVLIDVGAVVDAYRGDMTRTLFFGEPDPKLYHFFLAVQRAQQKAVVAVRPGIEFGQIDRIARESLQKEGVDHLFTHGISHGIGLETHEYPLLRVQGGDSTLVLQPGMVFTIEPGVYLPGLGGVRIEDTVRVTENGVENFFSGF